MKIKTSRFGEMEIEVETILTFPGGLIGFPEQERFIIVRHNPESPFFWLQAVDDPGLAFVIVDPLVFKPDYIVPIPPAVMSAMNATESSKLETFVIVTIPSGQPDAMTANMLGPIVVNSKLRLARQLVLDEKRYSHRYPILSGSNRGEGKQEEINKQSK